MTITTRPAPARHTTTSTLTPGEMNRAARLTGVLFLVTYVTSIPAVALYAPLNNHDFILGAGTDTSVQIGAFLEILLIVANVGTAITLFPVLRRHNETLALGFVASRIMESVFIGVGVLSVLTSVTLRNHPAGATDSALSTMGASLEALHDWTFALGPGFVVGVGNGLVLGYLMYRSGLVPRRMALLGLLGGSLIVISGAAVVFGVFEQLSVWSLTAALPEFVWELSLGVYLTVKGFRPSAISTDEGLAV
jgi:Domain of unknown function (DUF4386)